jgi:UDP-apiose/xylose synthase
MKTVCVVGVAGFIGSHLLHALLHETDYRVIGLDKEAPDKISRVLLRSDRVEFTQVDVARSSAALADAIERSDVVINLAAICNPSEYIRQPVATIHSNFTDAQECIELCVRHKKHLVHFSTCEVYGRTLSSFGLPAEDAANSVLDEETSPMVLGPLSAQRWNYACAKALAERLIYAHGAEEPGWRFTIVRPFNWIGGRMDYVPGLDGRADGQPRVIASFMSALMRDEPLVLVDGGVAYRSFCYIEDAVEAVLRMLERPERAAGLAFNVGNPENSIEIASLARLMGELYEELTGQRRGATVSIPGTEYYGKGYADSDLRLPSMRLVRERLGWAPSTPLRGALKRTMAAFIAQYGERLAKEKGAA